MSKTKSRSLFDPSIVKPALWASIRKLDPRHQVRNPVMFVVEVGSVFTTGLWIQALLGKGEAPAGFILAVALWLWFTVLFANLSEAMAEGRGKAQAANLRKARKDTPAKKLTNWHPGQFVTPAVSKPGSSDLDSRFRGNDVQVVSASSLRKGDIVLAAAGDTIPMDGEVIE